MAVPQDASCADVGMATGPRIDPRRDPDYTQAAEWHNSEFIQLSCIDILGAPWGQMIEFVQESALEGSGFKVPIIFCQDPHLCWLPEGGGPVSASLRAPTRTLSILVGDPPLETTGLAQDWRQHWLQSRGDALAHATHWFRGGGLAPKSLRSGSEVWDDRRSAPTLALSCLVWHRGHRPGNAGGPHREAAAGHGGPHLPPPRQAMCMIRIHRALSASWVRKNKSETWTFAGRAGGALRFGCGTLRAQLAQGPDPRRHRELLQQRSPSEAQTPRLEELRAQQLASPGGNAKTTQDSSNCARIDATSRCREPESARSCRTDDSWMSGLEAADEPRLDTERTTVLRQSTGRWTAPRT